jgi:hypothetical protein
MRRALTYIVVATTFCTPSTAAERKSWNRIRYVGGTVAVKTTRYDWNTTLTVNSDAIVVEIAPATIFGSQKTVRIKLSQVLSLSAGPAAWRHVAAVAGAQLPAKPPTLFGLLADFGFLGLVYDTDDGKRAAMLLDSSYPWAILPVLKALTGKPIEDSP